MTKLLLFTILAVSIAQGQGKSKLEITGELAMPDTLYLGTVARMDLNTGKMEFFTSVDSAAKLFAEAVEIHYRRKMELTIENFLYWWDEYKKECQETTWLEVRTEENGWMPAKQWLGWPMWLIKRSPVLEMREMSKQPDLLDFIDNFLRRKAGK